MVGSSARLLLRHNWARPEQASWIRSITLANSDDSKDRDGESASLESNIIAKLRKTGFPFEITTGLRIEKQGWSVSLNEVFFADTSREIDIYASRYWQLKHGNYSYSLYIHLIAECKQSSDQPWVFFTTEQLPSLTTALSSGAAYILASSPEYTNPRLADVGVEANWQGQQQAVWQAIAAPGHHYSTLTQRARTYHEPFKKSDQPSTIYAAMMSAIQAARYYQRVSTSSILPGSLHLYYPVIFFRGKLFNARIASDETISLEPVQHMQLHHRAAAQDLNPRMSIWSLGQNSIVDVVQEDHLEQFLSMLDTEHSAIAGRLQVALEEERIVGNDMAVRLAELIAKLGLAQDAKASTVTSGDGPKGLPSQA